MYEREKKKQSYRKEPKEKDSSIPGFISEELTLKILSEVFKVLKIVVYILLKFYVTFDGIVHKQLFLYRIEASPIEQFRNFL